jgi:NADPH-dependent 2,4-dienoyl-CoA reductase/sulfur reductase-like enzyme
MKHVIVGNGVAGVTAAQTIVRADPDAEVHVFGGEPFPYYRRPLLWEFIAGQIDEDAVYFRPLEWDAVQPDNCRIRPSPTCHGWVSLCPFL